MSRYSIDLSQLDPPDVVEALDYEAVLAQLKSDLGIYAALAGRDFEQVDLESDPVVTLLEVVAYRETLLRARVNDAGRAVMLATATGNDLEHLAALFGVARLVVTPADPNTIPPTPAVMEADDNLRARTQLALEGFSTAGPRGAYLFHTLSVDGRIVDVSVTNPDPGDVLVTYYAAEPDGVQVTDLDGAIASVLNGEDVRPLSDTVIVQSATVVSYDVTATIEVGSGPDAGVVLDLAREELERVAETRRIIGEPVPLSAIYAALHRAGVVAVSLSEPAADVTIAAGEVGILGAVSLTVA